MCKVNIKKEDLDKEDLDKWQQEYRRVALRFLKDAGLYYWWKKYINYEDGRNVYTGLPKPFKENWYKVTHIDSIFGRSSFSFFLRKNEVHLPYQVVHIFRYYLHIMYGDDKFPLDFPRRYDGLDVDLDGNVEIDPLTGTVKIKIKYDNIQN